MNKRFVRTFQPRFARLVECGKKRQTVRKRPKRMPEAGDVLDAREWTGAPYRSKQRKLGEWKIVEVLACYIDAASIKMQPPQGSMMHTLGVPVIDLGTGEEADRFARADGFEDWDDMRRWIAESHGFPVDGIVIYWEEWE